MMSTMCSKHVEFKNKNKYIEKNCASRWSFNKNHYIIHGQQNILKKHLSLYTVRLLYSTDLQLTTSERLERRISI